MFLEYALLDKNDYQNTLFQLVFTSLGPIMFEVKF